MRDPNLLQSLRMDLQRAPDNRVVYLEGKTDVDIVFALLGSPRSSDDTFDGVLIRGLSDRSGATAVKQRVETAQENDIKHVYGFINGDGRDLAELDALFSGPGPLFAWRGYNIETMLVRAGWPPSFGTAPDWPAVMRSHAALVALNRLGRRLREALDQHDLQRFIKPGARLKSYDRKTVRDSLVQARSIVSRDLAAEFDADADRFESMLDDNIEAAHAWLDGKWLVEHHVEQVLGIRERRAEWIAHVAASGGMTEVRDHWAKIRC